jgi:hypothetical protein
VRTRHRFFADLMIDWHLAAMMFLRIRDAGVAGA